MNWIPLTDLAQLEQIDQLSADKPQLIFKHSTRCNISADAKEELDPAAADAYYLDLLAHRDISDAIAQRYQVLHKSPQVLIISQGKCIYHESHWHIKTPVVLEQLTTV